MPGDHDKKLIADKYPLDYTRQRLFTRHWKWRYNSLALLIACGIAAALYAFRGNAAFWSAPVADVHSSFGTDCAKCHTESWQPALRIASLDSGRHSVPDSACQACHQTSDHHPRLGEQEPACATCHQDHRPTQSLLEISDIQCTSCHADLNSVPDSEIHFVDTIHQFDAGLGGHPEFALFGGTVDLPDKQHGAWQVAQPPTESASPKWLDNGGVLFNHKVHLAAEGILDPDRKQVQLTCAACHEPDVEGRRMKPIRYEQHCAACHPLQLSGGLAALRELPHEAPELVRGTIRERLAQLQVSRMNKLPAPEPTRIRRLPQPAKLTDEQAKSVEVMLAAADHAVFGLEAKGLCRKCHHLQIQGLTWVVPVQNPALPSPNSTETNVARSMVPSRWLRHGEFHHQKHATVACKECHAAAESSLTSDILLPSIENCRKCHTNSPATMGPSVSADCVLCHDYHAKSSTLAPGARLRTHFPESRQEEVTP